MSSWSLRSFFILIQIQKFPVLIDTYIYKNIFQHSMLQKIIECVEFKQILENSNKQCELFTNVSPKKKKNNL